MRQGGVDYLSPSFAVILMFLTALACSDAATEGQQPAPSPAAASPRQLVLTASTGSSLSSSRRSSRSWRPRHNRFLPELSTELSVWLSAGLSSHRGLCGAAADNRRDRVSGGVPRYIPAILRKRPLRMTSASQHLENGITSR